MLALPQPVTEHPTASPATALTPPLAARIPGETLLGRSGNDLLSGTGGDDVMSGFAGKDLLRGGHGDDSLSGGLDDDILIGNSGNDVLYGNEGDDRIRGRSGDDFAAGGEGNDIIFGGGGNDTLAGADGDDFIDGGGGRDIIAGDLSDEKNRADVVDGGAGRDTLTYARCSSGVFADLDYGSDVLGNVDAGAIDVNDTLIINIEDVTGSALTDYLAGDEVGNGLTGLDGDDMIYGRGGHDRLTGGKGADSFLYAAASEGGDVIRDYEQGADHIVLSSDGFGGIDQGNLIGAFQRSKDGEASHTGPKIVLQTEGEGAGNLYYDADGEMPGDRQLIATLHFTSEAGLASFGMADFLFV